jgi:hypothetical protein
MKQLALDKSQWTDICKLGQGQECCRYLIAGSVGFQCAKLDSELKDQLDSRVAKGKMTACGDNCEGKPMYDER